MLDRLRRLFEPRVRRSDHEKELELVATEARKRGYTEALDDPYYVDPDALLPGASNHALYREAFNRESHKDFTPPHRERLRHNAVAAHGTKGHPKNKIEINLDYVLGEGLKPAPQETDKEKAKDFGEWLDEFWTDSENALEARHHGMMASALVEGEFFLRVGQIDKADGKILWGTVEPKDVVDVQQDRFRRDVVALVRNPEDPNNHLRFAILNHLPQEVEVFTGVDGEALFKRPGAGKNAEGVDVMEEYDGAIFSLSLNRISGARRGKPDLVPVLDYDDLHDETVFRVAERARALTALLLDVTVTNPDTPTEIDEVIKNLKLDAPLKTLQTMGHSDRIALNYLAPDLGVEQMAILERLLRLVSYGALGLPEAFSGAGDDTNRATLDAQNSVPARRLGRRQKEVIGFWKLVVRFACREAIRAGVLTGDEKGEPEAFLIDAPEIGSRDQVQVTTSLSQLATALVGMISENAIKLELASKIFTQALQKAGYDFDQGETGIDAERIAEGKEMASTQFGTGPADEDHAEKAKTAFQEAETFLRRLTKAHAGA